MAGGNDTRAAKKQMAHRVVFDPREAGTGGLPEPVCEAVKPQQADAASFDTEPALASAHSPDVQIAPGSGMMPRVCPGTMTFST